MNTTALSRRRDLRRWAIAAAALAMLLLGATAAWFLTQPQSLVAPAAANAHVTPEKSILLQYLLAARLNTPEAWQRVVEFHPRKPANEYYVHRAQQQLIRIQLARHEYDLALRLCDELVALDPKNAEFRAFGYAARAIALAGKGDSKGSAEAIAAFTPLADHLHDPAMLQRLNANQEKSKSSPGADSAPPSK